LKPQWGGKPLVQEEKYQEENAYNKREREKERERNKSVGIQT